MMGDASPGLRESGDLTVSQRGASLRGPHILARLVVDSMEAMKAGDRSSYSAVCEQLSQSTLKAIAMRRWLQALRLCVLKLTKEFDVLVGTILRLRWAPQDPDIVSLYIDFLAHLTSAHTHYLKSILLSLTSDLFDPALGPDYAYHNVHTAIRTITELVPTAPSVLMPLLAKGVPFRLKGAEFQEVAMRNVLFVTGYCPTLCEGALDVCVHMVLAIDVEVLQIEVEDEGEGGEGGVESDGGEELEEDTCEEIQFHVELEVDPSSPSSPHSLGSSPLPLPLPPLSPVLSKKPRMGNPAADKLDIMMTILFQYLHSVCYQNGTLHIEQSVQLFQILMKIFEQVVLPTHACSHVQFLLFGLTTYHEAFPSHLMDFLWEKFQDVSSPAVIRQTSALYLASFIARAKFVPVSVAKQCLAIGMQWTHHYLDGCDPEQLRLDVSHHGPFYALSQAMFYVFVFRHQALMDMEGGVSFLQQLNFERLISSRLNPLKVALPSVVDMFASLTSHHEIVFCYTILEQNKRLVLPTPTPSTPSHAASSPSNHLDCFFPFDPYRLKRSGCFVQPFYQEWEDTTSDVGRAREKEEDGVGDTAAATSPFSSSMDSLSHAFSCSLGSPR